MALEFCPHCGMQTDAWPPDALPHSGAPSHCGNCGGVLSVAMTDAQRGGDWDDQEITLATPVEDGVATPHWQENVAYAEPIDDMSATPAGEPAEYTPRRRIPFEIIFFLSTLALLLGVGATAALLLIYYRGDPGSASSGAGNSASQYVSTSNAEDQRPHRWLPAKQGALRMGKTKIEIVRADFSEARGKDSSGTVVISENRYLHVILRVENTGHEPLTYRSWYGNDFPTEAGAVRAGLHDNHDVDYPWKIFEDFQRVRWHLPEATIEPFKYIEDVIIFQVPPDVDHAMVDYLRLALPAAALGREGFYYFELPRDMIVDF